jgi:hypothetical protein
VLGKPPKDMAPIDWGPRNTINEKKRPTPIITSQEKQKEQLAQQAHPSGEDTELTDTDMESTADTDSNLV